ncbi:neurogenic locus notch-like protein, partial [Brachionus plicatilis]
RFFQFSNIDVCKLIPKPCLNGGICTNLPYSYMCTCLPGFTVCDPTFCINGKCVEKNGILKCDCDNGWSGPLCNDFEIQSCDYNQNACQNGGTCKNVENDKYKFNSLEIELLSEKNQFSNLQMADFNQEKSFSLKIRLQLILKKTDIF